MLQAELDAETWAAKTDFAPHSFTVFLMCKLNKSDENCYVIPIYQLVQKVC